MKRVARPLKALYGRIPAAEFGVIQFKTVWKSLIAEDHSRSHVNELMSRMVTIFRWGAGEGKIPAHIPRHCRSFPDCAKGARRFARQSRSSLSAWMLLTPSCPSSLQSSRQWFGFKC